MTPGTPPALAQTPSAAPPPTPPQVVERGANHSVWQRTVYETKPDGTVVPKIHKFTELATGLNYKKTVVGKVRRSKLTLSRRRSCKPWVL